MAIAIETSPGIKNVGSISERFAANKKLKNKELKQNNTTQTSKQGKPHQNNKPNQ
jgi:hypothetical protein